MRDIRSVDEYVHTLERIVAGTRRGGRLVVEVVDHLQEATARAVASGLPRDEAEVTAIHQCGRPEDVARLSVRWFPLVVTRGTRRLAPLQAAGWGGLALLNLLDGSPHRGHALGWAQAAFAVIFAMQAAYYWWRRRRGELVEVPSRTELPRWQHEAMPWVICIGLTGGVGFVIGMYALDPLAWAASAVVTFPAIMLLCALIQRRAWRRHLSSPWR